MGYQICQVQMPHYPYFTEEVINQMAVLVPDYDKCCTLLLDMVYGDSTTIEQAIEKMEAGTINQYTYTQGSGQQQQTDTDPNAQLQQQQQQQQYY
jgi:transcription initiation factor TFIID subunit TAF12